MTADQWPTDQQRVKNVTKAIITKVDNDDSQHAGDDEGKDEWGQTMMTITIRHGSGCVVAGDLAKIDLFF